jgi:AcrR family transcriptional regulator
VSEVTTLTERPLRADARRNRERIIAAARELFAELGRDAQMDDLAGRAGVGVGTVYRHFPTKEAVLAELLHQRFAAFNANAAAALESDGEPFEVLADLLRANAELMAADVATRHALMQADDAVWCRAAAERDELTRRAGELVERAQRAGTLRADFSVEEIPMLMCAVSSTMGHPAGQFDWRRHLELVLDALRAPGAGRPAPAPAAHSAASA